MSTQVYRADVSQDQADGAVLWFAEWQAGRTLSRINKCRLASLAGDMRSTVYITQESDTYFSTPAVCVIKGCRITGYVTTEDEQVVFRHTYY